MAEQQKPQAPKLVIRMIVEAYDNGNVTVHNIPQNKLAALDVLSNAMQAVIRWQPQKIVVPQGVAIPNIGGDGHNPKRKLKIKGA